VKLQVAFLQHFFMNMSKNYFNKSMYICHSITFSVLSDIYDSFTSEIATGAMLVFLSFGE
jgi:hypothetical protein